MYREWILKPLVHQDRISLATADGLMAQGRVGAARGAYQTLLEKAQESGDRDLECASRAMLARCALRSPTPDAGLRHAAEHLAIAEALLQEVSINAGMRARGSQARLAVATAMDITEAQRELEGYLLWAQRSGDLSARLDALHLLIQNSASEAKITWLEMALNETKEAEDDAQSAALALMLGSELEAAGNVSEAEVAYMQALNLHVEGSDPRVAASAAWALGVLKGQADDDPGSRELLQKAIDLARSSESTRDILAFALADLSRSFLTGGDEVEARRLLLDSLQIGRDEGLEGIWAERWQALIRYGRALELDV